MWPLDAYGRSGHWTEAGAEPACPSLRGGPKQVEGLLIPARVAFSGWFADVGTHLVDEPDGVAVVMIELVSLIIGALEHLFRVPEPLTGPSTSMSTQEFIDDIQLLCHRSRII
jgi:hypothetical protein